MKLCKLQVVFAFIILGVILFVGPFIGLILFFALILWVSYCNKQRIADFILLLEERKMDKPIFHDHEEETKEKNELLR